MRPGLFWPRLKRRSWQPDFNQMSKSLNFEEALKRLEEIVSCLEEADLSLDDSLKFFEEGMKLSSLCQKKLSAAQRKVEVLIKGEDGKVKAEPF